MKTDEQIDTEEEFHDRLRELLTTASRSGVDVAGGWPVLNDDPDDPDWDVEILELLTSGR